MLGAVLLFLGATGAFASESTSRDPAPRQRFSDHGNTPRPVPCFSLYFTLLIVSHHGDLRHIRSL